MSCCTSINERRAGGPQTQPTYSAAVENRGDSTYVATTRHGTFVMSTGGRGPNPVDTLLASLSACIGHYVHDFLRDRKLENDGFTVDANATSTPDGARLGSIEVTIGVNGVVLDDHLRQEILLAAEHCKVHNTLKTGCDIRLSVASGS